MHLQGQYSEDWKNIAEACKEQAGWCCIRCGHPHDRESGHVLTVHHFDGDKGNNQWWNLLALCQRCHLQIQGKVDPEMPWFLEHSDWIKPYVAGFYAHKYRGEILTRDEVSKRMDELLALELAVSANLPEGR